MYLPWYSSTHSAVPIFFMTRLVLYIIQIDDWWKWYDLNIPDDAWTSIVQNADLETLIEITDPGWLLAIQIAMPEFLTEICIE